MCMVTLSKIGATYPQHLIFGLKVNSLTLLITIFLMTKGGCFNANGVNIFQALNLKLQFKSNGNMFHLSPMFLVWLIKLIWLHKPFHTYHWYFTFNFFVMFVFLFQHNPKRHLEVTKLVKNMKTKGNKIFQNMKTR